MIDAARNLVVWIEERIGDLSAVDWALLAAGAAALIWVWLRIRASNRLGPVEVEVLVHDGDGTSKPKVQALTAMLRERLANSGLSPPQAVPAGAPQTDLIAAIETSDVPQAKWIARMIEALPWPKPLGFKLSGTLYGPGDDPAKDKPAAQRGIRIWLRPTAGGRELLEDVPGPDFEKAVCAAADRVFMHISEQAVSVFPIWARWTDRDALHCYVEGLGALKKRDNKAARRSLRTAARLEPQNILPRVLLANLYEQELPDIGSRAGPAPDLRPHAAVLRRYLDLAVERPELVEPRYRASVVAGVLATACEKRNELPQSVAERFGLDNTRTAKELRDLSERESDAALQLVRAWYVPLRLLRMRHRYEPTGHERQLLHRGLAISGHCLRVRSRFQMNQRWKTFGLWRRRAVVWGFHLQAGRATTGWHAHYNAACFYALLDQREDVLPSRTDSRWRTRLWRRNPIGSDTRRRRRLRRAAYRHLNRTIEEGSELSNDWIETSDPDLASLRKSSDHEWEVLKARLHLERPPAGAQPERPWGSPILRLKWWMGALVATTLATGAAVVAMIAGEELWELTLIAGAAAIGISIWRLIGARREVRVTSRQPTAGSPADAT